MDWMRAGLLWGTGIAFASGLLLAILFWLSNSNDQAEVKTAGIVHSAVTAEGKLVVPFAPYRVRVETLGAGSTISHVNFRVVVDDEAKKQHLCRRLPMVMEVLAAPNAQITYSASSYFVFQPVVSKKKKDGTFTQLAIGRYVDTTTKTMLAHTPFAVHEEEQINYRIPKGSLVGVQVTIVGTPTSNNIGLMAAVRHAG